MKKKPLFFLIKNNLYDEIIKLYTPEEISKSLTFDDGLRLAYHLLYNEDWNDEFQYYSVELLKQIRQLHLAEWEKSWKNDALLGMSCYITYQHEDRYEAYKKSFEKCKEPPPGLLIEFARCSVCPGPPPISYDKAIDLVMKAINKTPYSDGINLLCNLYSLKNDDVNKSYWEKKLAMVTQQKEELHSPSIEPDFLVREFLQEIKKNKIISKKNFPY